MCQKFLNGKLCERAAEQIPYLVFTAVAAGGPGKVAVG